MPTVPRPTCYRCFRPAAMCLCAAVVPISNRSHISVLQHPRERFHPFGTVRFVELGLSNATVHRAGRRGLRSGLARPLSLLPRTGLLYPTPGSRSLAQTPADQRPRNLLVLDGTWSQAHCLYRDNPWLGDVPHYHLDVTTPGRYRIRAEPAAHCLSTIEAIARALSILEPTTSGLEHLLDGFDAMVDGQLRHRAKVGRRPRFNRRLQSV